MTLLTRRPGTSLQYHAFVTEPSTSLCVHSHASCRPLTVSVSRPSVTLTLGPLSLGSFWARYLGSIRGSLARNSTDCGPDLNDWPPEVASVTTSMTAFSADSFLRVWVIVWEPSDLPSST